MRAPTSPALLDRVRLRLAERQADPTPDQVAEALRAEGRLIGDVAVLDVVEELRRDTLGAGPLEPLLRRPGITDVVVNGCHAAYVDTGSGLEAVDVGLSDEAAVRRLAQRLAASAGRRLDDSSPYVDVRLPDGTRFHAVLAPVSRSGTCLSLRVPSRRPLSVADLVQRGTVSSEGADLLLDIVRRRLAFLVSGGTGSGKTTLLAALLGHVDPHDRVVIVEDSTELSPRHPHVVSLESRPANVEGAGEVTMRELVRQALRMRPDRLIVGEVRGAEVVDLLAAMNTGHEGGAGTVHANTAGNVPARFEALGCAAGLSRAAVHSQLGAAVDVVVHLHRGGDGIRRVAEVGVLERDTAGWVQIASAVSFDRAGRATTGPGAARLDARLTGS